MTLNCALNKPCISLCFMIALYNYNLVFALQTVNSRMKINEKKYNE